MQNGQATEMESLGKFPQEGLHQRAVVEVPLLLTANNSMYKHT